MKRDLHVAKPPQKPLLVYDGDCGFCLLWIKRWRQATGDRVEYLPYQDAGIHSRFPEVPREQFETSVQLIETDGRVYSGAEAALRSRAHNPNKRWLLNCYNGSAIFATAAETIYGFVAGHRTLFSALTRIAYGKHVEQPTQFLTRWVFLRSLGLIFLIAFLSLWSQLSGLIGSNGIQPANQFMASVAERATFQGMGIERFWLMPTLCWINASDGFLNVLCVLGVAISALLMAGVAPRLALFLLWLIYLSLSVAGQTFLSFQWDTLLLETGFFAIFYAPRQWLPSLSRESPPSRVSVWLLRWLLFRLMFQSGITKLLYDDPTWLNLTALTLHYETQPLPTWLGWYAHQLPLWFQKASCLAMYFIEVVVPFLFFAPRRLRFSACAATIFLQLVIGLTGNYNFFNLLTIVLCLSLLDDAALRAMLPGALRRGLTQTFQKLCSRRREEADGARVAGGPPPHVGGYTLSAFREQCEISGSKADSQPDGEGVTLPWRKWLAKALVVVVVLITTVQMAFNLRMNVPWPKPLLQLTMTVTPFRTLNSFGLFRVMTTTRPEIVVEGSNDGMAWLPYDFKYKPGNLSRRPAFVAPHQPRLDWQMWFAALGNVEGNPWFVNFCVRLLQGQSEVLALLKTNPFPDKPPKYVRAALYEYHFTDMAERKRTGDWWRRELKGEYLRPISLREGN